MFYNVMRLVNGVWTSTNIPPENARVGNKYTKGKMITYDVGNMRYRQSTTPYHSQPISVVQNIVPDNERSKMKALVIDGGSRSKYVLAVDMSNTPTIFTKDGEPLAIGGENTNYGPFSDIIFGANHKPIRNSEESVYGEIPKKLMEKYRSLLTRGRYGVPIFFYNYFR